jgi:hypothetical protein
MSEYGPGTQIQAILNDVFFCGRGYMNFIAIEQRKSYINTFHKCLGEALAVELLQSWEIFSLGGRYYCPAFLTLGLGRLEVAKLNNAFQ